MVDVIQSEVAEVALERPLEVDNNNGDQTVSSSQSTSWIERKVPIALLFVLVVQLFAGIWAVSSFYTEQELNKIEFSKKFDDFQSDFNKLQNEIYTRKEATVQFEALNQVNARQDEEIRELNREIRNFLILYTKQKDSVRD